MCFACTDWTDVCMYVRPTPAVPGWYDGHAKHHRDHVVAGRYTAHPRNSPVAKSVVVGASGVLEVTTSTVSFTMRSRWRWFGCSSWFDFGVAVGVSRVATDVCAFLGHVASCPVCRAGLRGCRYVPFWDFLLGKCMSKAGYPPLQVVRVLTRALETSTTVRSFREHGASWRLTCL